MRATLSSVTVPAGLPYTSLISSHFVDNPASGRVMEKCGFGPTGETSVDESLHSGESRLMKVLRLEL